MVIGGQSSSVAADETVLQSPIRPGDQKIADTILAQIIAYVPTLRESAKEAEQIRRVPERVIADLASFGVFKIATPTEYGGFALTPTQQHDIVTQIARGCGATAWVVWVTQTATQWMSLLDRRFQDELFGSEWAGPAIAGVANQHGPGTARPVDGGYMLKGKWPFCSGGHHAKFLMLGAICHTEGAAEPIICMVPNKEAVILDDWTVAGLSGTGSNTVFIEDEIFVPAHRVLTVRELAEHRCRSEKAQGLLYDIHFIPLTACVHSAVSLGMAQAAIEMFKARAPNRAIAHSHYTVQSEAPITHLQLGELHCKLRLAELMARDNVAAVEAWALAGKGLDEREFARSKLESAYVAKIASEITTLVLRASGASSIHQNSIFQRLFRDVQVTTMHGHTNIETCSEEFGRADVGLARPVSEAQI